MVFPELCLSAYAIDDLLFQDAVLDEVVRQVDRLICASRDLFPAFVVGAPLRSRGQLYNCGVVIHRGELLGVVPKVFLPNYREFYERRHFTSGEGVIGQSIAIAGHEAGFGRDLLFAGGGKVGFAFHIEICEDLWVPQPPSTSAALAGAEILLNLSASNITIGKAQMRRLLCASQSARCIAAYAYSAAGAGEFDHRPRLGRPGRRFRMRRRPRRDAALLGRARDRHRRCRSRAHPPGANADQYLWRLRARRR